MYVEPRPKGRHFRPDDRIAIQALYKAGHSQREIAKILNSNQMMVSRLLKKALKQLFQILSEKNDDIADK